MTDLPEAPEASDCPPARAPCEASRLVDVDALARAIDRFADERDWVRFHAPKNLVMALTGEVGELNEIFQWMSEKESRQAATAEETARAVRDEVADVLIYLVRLADVLGIDLDEAVRTKMQTNADKYPVDRARGHCRKYDRY